MSIKTTEIKREKKNEKKNVKYKNYSSKMNHIFEKKKKKKKFFLL